MAALLERCKVLKDMIDSQTTCTLSGETIPIHSNIPLAYAESLYETVRRLDPAVVLEVGLAFGFSALAILSALRDGNRKGKLISIDPVQTSGWKGCGRAAIARAGFSDQHELIEDYDYNALPRLLASGIKCDFAYIDGWHTFDYVLVDWWYIDKMLAVDGIVGFNDCGWPAIAKVIRFVLTHRNYTEIDVGLPVKHAITRTQELLRRLMFRSKGNWYRREEDRYFKKNAHWEPRWDYYAPF